ncbi:MAG: hypothetical protein ACRDA5_01445 [Clostridium sp.]
MGDDMLTTVIFKRYEQGKAYKQSMGLPTKWNTYNKFKNGDQWATPTKATATMPRPVFNFIDQILNHKVSDLQNENVKMVFSDIEGTDEEAIKFSDLFSKYSETTWEQIKQDELNQEALENASLLGIGIWHYYFDADVEGGRELAYIGEIKGEILDPMNVVFGNPNCTKIQEQPYIIMRSRALVEDVKNLAMNNEIAEEKISLIKADKDNNDSTYDKAQIEVEGTDKINLYTMYYKKRVEGETKIFFTKATKGTVVQEETEAGISLYPIVIMNWQKDRENIYGRGEVEGLIPNQKLVNFLMAIETYNHQLTGFPKMIFKNGAINPSTITNQVGEIIEDLSQGQGFNVQYLNPPQIGSKAQNLAETVLQITKDLKGATESNTGANTGSQLNATAIMLLQKASGIPIEAIRKRFYQAIEDTGRIWEQFWKNKYDTERIINIKDDNNKDINAEFRGTDAKEYDMKLKIDIGQASSYTETFTVTALDKFLASGYITFEQYLKYVPNTVVPFKNQLLKEIEVQKQKDMMMAQEQALSILNPAERQIYESSSPEIQAQMLDAIMQEAQMGQVLQGQATQQGQPNKQEIGPSGQPVNPNAMVQGNNGTMGKPI